MIRAGRGYKMDGNKAKKVTIRMKKIARKKVFAEVVAAKQVSNSPPEWKCCNWCFGSAIDIHKHISLEHNEEIENKTMAALKEGRSVCNNSKYTLEIEAASDRQEGKHSKLHVEAPLDPNNILKQSIHLASTISERADQVGGIVSKRKLLYSEDDVQPWLPMIMKSDSEEEENRCEMKNGQVLLFYKYTDLEDPEDICEWQKELCRRLYLHGKIRIAREGLNGTVGGEIARTQQYIGAVMAHPCFRDMRIEDFKTSSGGLDSFPGGLVVSLHQEIVPMGVDPLLVSFKDAGCHLTPAEFHDEIERHRTARERGQETDTVFIDCRNFYESRIGVFRDAITPDIRKFSYWPEYVDKNEAMFADKKVLMYCTGGIRCERGSAYLRSKGICKEVLQLEGGIHKYLDQYPDGFFRGKLFVFDDRYAIQTNQDVLAECFHCSKPWDEYQPCSSDHCHQLVLSCPSCRTAGFTTCCKKCAELAVDYASGENGKIKKRREECSCTMNRERIPVEKLNISSALSSNKVGVDVGLGTSQPAEGGALS